MRQFPISVSRALAGTARMAAIVWIALACPAVVAAAGEADVVDVRVTPQSDGYRFDVTIRHDDTGWDHYADKWQVVGPDGTVLGERLLLHPHVDEQPFTRSLSRVQVPDGVVEVTIRGHDSVHGWGGKVIAVALPDRQ